MIDAHGTIQTEIKTYESIFIKPNLSEMLLMSVTFEISGFLTVDIILLRIIQIVENRFIT